MEIEFESGEFLLVDTLFFLFFLDHPAVFCTLLGNKQQFVLFGTQNRLQLPLSPHHFSLLTAFRLDQLIDIVLPVLQLLQLLSFADEGLQDVFVLPLLCLDKFVVGAQLILQIVDGLHHFLVLEVQSVDAFFCFFIELADFLVHQLQFLYLLLNVHILILLSLYCQLDVVNHFLEFANRKSQLPTLIQQFFSLFCIQGNLH